jgi:DNA repair protein RadC
MTEKNKTTGIKSWPQDDRPREKLLKKGAVALSNSELLAILLRTGGPVVAQRKELYDK